MEHFFLLSIDRRSLEEPWMNSRPSFNIDLNSSENWLEEHSHSPYHKFEISHHTHAKTIASQHCSDTVTLQLVIKDQVIHEAWHTAQGCLVAQASASFLCQWSEGKSIKQLQATKETDDLNLLGPLTPMRQQCALLAFRCLQKALVTS